MEKDVLRPVQEDSRFRIVVPGNSLSFSQYKWGGRLFARALPQRPIVGRLITFLIVAFMMFFIFSIIIGLQNKEFFLMISAWSYECDTPQYLFNLAGFDAAIALLAIFIAGLLILTIRLRLRYRHYLRSMYHINETIKTGYILELSERGIRWTSKNINFFVLWNKVMGVANHDGIDYVDLGTLGFLWIPGDSPDYPSDEVKAFIKQHISEHHR